MAIILRLDRVMADRKISLKELAEKVEISNVNLSNLKTGKVKAIRFSTLDAICRELNCQPGDILEYQEDQENKEEP
ncbi:MAG TPA: helix-turn-helix transcriptional regulator [Candidatus Mediterraneibacter vanvlietii]|nr:helix-turn-helix transcriptional regulator [Candidatus Mediterraneibacter vanvlietii]